MKQRILLIIAAVLCCAMTIFAQNNDRISYQAVVRDANNNLVVNRELTVQVTVNDGQNTYTETHTVTSNANGLISLLIGNGTHASNNWDNINWKTATVSTTMSDGGVQIAAHAMPLTTVPSAKYADYADSVNPDVVARQIHDTADIVRQKVGDVSEEVADLENRMKADSANLKNNYTTTVELQNNYYNKVKMNDTIDYILTQLANTSGNLNDNYYTKAQVDTAKAHIRTEMATKDAQLQHNIDTASSQIREAMAMMNSALQSEIALKADSSSVYTTTQIDNKFADTVRYATKAKVKADSNVVFDTLHTYYATKSAVNSQLSNYTTTAELQNTYATKTNVSEGLDSVKGHIRTEITALKTNADAIYATKAKVKADSNVVFDTLHTYYATKSAVASQLSNYTTTTALEATYATKTNVSEGLDSVKGNIRTEIGAVKSNIAENYATKTEVTTNVDSVKGNIRTEITALKTNADAIYATKAKVKADSNVVFDTLHNYYATKSSVASQLSNYTTTAELQNTYATKTDLNDYTTTTALEANYATKDKVKADSNVVFDTLHNYYATKSSVASQLNNYTTTAELQNTYATKTDLNDYTTTTALEANYATKDKVKADSNVVFDTLHNYYATKSSVASQLSNYTTTAALQNMLSQPLERLAELYYTKEVSDKFIATENQTTFTLSNSPTENHLVKMYINGVLVGDNDNSNANFPAVITLSDPQVTYIPNSNGNYQLRDGDRIVFYYYTILPSQGDSN